MGRSNQCTPPPSRPSRTGRNAGFDVEGMAIQIQKKRSSITNNLRCLMNRQPCGTFETSDIKETIDKLEEIFQADEFLRPFYKLKVELSEMSQVGGKDEAIGILQDTLNSSHEAIENLLVQVKCLLLENPNANLLPDFLKSVSNVVTLLQNCTNMSAVLFEKLIEMQKEMEEKEKRFEIENSQIWRRYMKLIGENDELKKENKQLREDKTRDLQIISSLLDENQCLKFENVELKKDIESLREEIRNLKNERLISRRIRLTSLFASLATCWGVINFVS